MIKTILIAAYTCVLLNTAMAQTADSATNALIAGMFRETEQTKNAILQKFSSVLTPQQKAVFDTLRFSIDRNSWNVGEVYADTGVVSISMGFASHVGIINGAFAYEIYEGTTQNRLPNTDRATEFANYYIDTLLAKSTAARLGRTEPVVKSYFQWLGMSPAEIADLVPKLSRNDEYKRTSAMMNEINLAVVLGHELGHHVLQHVPVRAPLGPREETAADAFAFELAVKAGYPPIGAVGTFMMLDRFERRNGAARSVTHPPSLCRWFRAAVSGWNAIKDDKALIADYARRGRSNEIEQMNALLSKGEAAAAEQCPAAPVGLCEIIQSYFSSPPKTFVSERGEPAGTGRWEVKTAMPNASCFIRQRDRGQQTTHVFRCHVNSKNSEQVVQQYYTDASDEVSACIKQMSNSARWTMTQTDETDDDERTIGRNWSYTDDSTALRIEVEMTSDLKRSQHGNWLALEYVHK